MRFFRSETSTYGTGFLETYLPSSKLEHMVHIGWDNISQIHYTIYVNIVAFEFGQKRIAGMIMTFQAKCKGRFKGGFPA